MAQPNIRSLTHSKWTIKNLHRLVTVGSGTARASNVLVRLSDSADTTCEIAAFLPHFQTSAYCPALPTEVAKALPRPVRSVQYFYLQLGVSLAEGLRRATL